MLTLLESRQGEPSQEVDGKAEAVTVPTADAENGEPSPASADVAPKPKPILQSIGPSYAAADPVAMPTTDETAGKAKDESTASTKGTLHAEQ